MVRTIETSCTQQSRRFKNVLFLCVFAIIVLIIFVCLLATGVINSSSTKSGTPSLAVKQVFNGLEDENNISSHFVYNQSSTHIAWISFSSQSWTNINFAKCQSDAVIFCPDMILKLDKLSISGISISDFPNFQCAISEPTQIHIYTWSESEFVWSTSQSLKLLTGGAIGPERQQTHLDAVTQSESQRCMSSCFTSNGNLVTAWIEGKLGKLEVVGVRDLVQMSDKTVIVPEASTMYGSVMKVTGQTICVSDTFNECVFVFNDRPALKQTIKNSTRKKSFGSQISLDPSANRLFVSYSSKEEVVEYYSRSNNNSLFIRIQSIYNSLLTTTVAFPNFGYSISCNEEYLAISAPSEDTDNYSSIQIYHFRQNGEVDVASQNISIDVPFVGKSMWLYPMKKSNVFGKLTLIATNERASSFGQLIVFQNLVV